MNKTYHSKLLANKKGNYSLYVFLDLDSKEYIMCTLLPNWDLDELCINDTGYLNVDIISPGDSYINSFGNIEKYKYPNIYIKTFVKENKDINDHKIVLK